MIEKPGALAPGFFGFPPLANCGAGCIITPLYNDVTGEIPVEETSVTTLEKIQEAAMAEFLDKGFQGASLRQIVKNAGVTTGAFYGYFSSKEALFASIVEPHAAALMG